MRMQSIDLLRGIAIALMVIYHFCFDLSYVGFAQFNFNYDVFWLSFRALIISLFLGLVGISFSVAAVNGFVWRKVAIRLALLVGCAALVSVSSKVLFPASWIYFGILHFIAVASILALFFVRWHWTNLAVGVGCILVGLKIQSPLFDQPAL